MPTASHDRKKRRPRQLLKAWPAGEVVDDATDHERADVVPLAAVIAQLRDRIDVDRPERTALAARAGMSRSTLNRTLDGEVWPSFEHVTSLARALRMPEVMRLAADRITPVE